jgi:hypothetical protein
MNMRIPIQLLGLLLLWLPGRNGKQWDLLSHLWSTLPDSSDKSSYNFLDYVNTCFYIFNVK